MAKAIRFHETGGPEVLKLETVEVGEPGPGQARVRHTLRGGQLHRHLLPHRPLPAAAAQRAGLATPWAWSRRWAQASPTSRSATASATCSARRAPTRTCALMPAEVLIPLPDGVSDRTASTLMMKGMTAQYLFRQVYPLKGGETILYHAAAGGVGLVACQWARAHRRDDDRHRQHRREGRGGAGPRLRAHHRHRRARTSPSACARSPAARACRWSTTRSARTR